MLALLHPATCSSVAPYFNPNLDLGNPLGGASDQDVWRKGVGGVGIADKKKAVLSSKIRLESPRAPKLEDPSGKEPKASSFHPMPRQLRLNK